MTSSLPTRDDDALTFRIASQQQNAIQYLYGLVDLVALTVGGEFRIFPEGGAAITPGTLDVTPQAYTGSARVQPVLTSSSLLFVQSQGSRLRELTYNPFGVGNGVYKSADISLFAPHLFNGYQIKEIAFVREPDATVWAVRTDGVLLGLTYVPDQQVYGWHQHVTSGFFESLAVIPEGAEDVLYAVVRRTINGRTARYVERLRSRIFTDPADAFYVDCGLTYGGAPTMTVSGLSHLEGSRVDVLADGAVVAGQVVTGGAVQLPVAASKVHIGLNYVSDMATLPAVFDSAPASGQGTMKNVSKVYLRVSQSSMVQAGPSFDKLTTYPARAVSDNYGSPPALRAGELAVSITPNWNTDATVCIRQDQPLPLTVDSLTTDDAIGG